MKFQNTRVMNFQGAFRGLRNPLESWNKSDSQFGIDDLEYCDNDYQVANRWEEKDYRYDFETEYDKWQEKQEYYAQWLRDNGCLHVTDRCVEYAFLGPNDLNLAKRMIKAGSSDRKFLRQIFVSVDITAPLYWYKEFDTYKVGTVANSTSTMHKLATTPITIDCFETDDYNRDIVNIGENTANNIPSFYETLVIPHLELLRKKYLETKDKRYWKELIRWLP